MSWLPHCRRYWPAPGEYRPRLLFTAQALAGGSSMRSEKHPFSRRIPPCEKVRRGLYSPGPAPRGPLKKEFFKFLAQCCVKKEIKRKIPDSQLVGDGRRGRVGAVLDEGRRRHLEALACRSRTRALDARILSRLDHRCGLIASIVACPPESYTVRSSACLNHHVSCASRRGCPYRSEWYAVHAIAFTQTRLLHRSPTEPTALLARVCGAEAAKAAESR